MNYAHSIKDAMDLAEAKASIEGWKAYVWERKHGGDLITGCVPDGEYTRGPRKGRPRFSRPVAGTRLSVVVTSAELDARAAAFEREECLCWRCKGTGREITGWSRDAGSRDQPCHACEGTGKPHNS